MSLVSRLGLVWHTLLRWAFVGALWVFLVLALLPVEDIPNTLLFWDKAQHTLAFLFLTLLGLLAFNKPGQGWAVLVGVLLYGGLIEVLQEKLTHTRHGDWWDWLADAIGVLLAYLLLHAYRRWWGRVKAHVG